MNTSMKLAGFTAESNGRYITRRPLTPEQIIKAGQTLSKRLYLKKRKDEMSDPFKVGTAIQAELSNEQREIFAVMFLDNRHCMIAFERMFYGTINGAAVYPREVVKRALELNAAALIVAHNHPSGDPTPSKADMAITETLKAALTIVDIRLLDHFVIGAASFSSLAGAGMI